jgi:hypothetical protein
MQVMDWLILDRKIHSKRAKDSELYIAIAKKCFNGIISVTSKLGIGGFKTSCCLSECMILIGRNQEKHSNNMSFLLVSAYVWYCAFASTCNLFSQKMHISLILT